MKIHTNALDKDHHLLTKSGYFVCSKGEREVANFLSSQGIRFLYEPTVPIGQRWNHPDFYLLDDNIYIEFFGWEHDKKYDEDRRKKQRQFNEQHLNLISLYPHQVGSLGAVIRAAYQEMKSSKFPQKQYFNWKISRKHA